MEEDDVVKAPVTRLRRRMSVENDVASPVAPSSPTKKRLAAKPQLHNIDELAAVKSPRGNRRTPSVWGAEEAPEEKPMTPARRSTRIKSNTSITSEVVQSFNSPRAKRAARRNSTVGSDSEAPLTPIRKTRRTRKDSASSIENQENVTIPTQITKETISEEPEAPKTSANNSLSSDSISPNSLRKSQRIAAKRFSRNSLHKSDAESNTSLNQSKLSETIQNDVQTVKSSPKLPTIMKDHENINEGIKGKLNSSKSKETSINENEQQTRKSRSKSLTNTPEPSSGVAANENIKQTDKSFNLKNPPDDVRAGDAFLSAATVVATAKQSPRTSDKENMDIVLNTSKRIKRESQGSVSSTKSDKSDKASKKGRSSDKTDGIDTVDTSTINSNDLEPEKMLQETEAENIKCKVYIEDSDSNACAVGKSNKVQSNGTDDQCVPVVEKLNESDEKCNLIIENQAPSTEPENNKSSLFASKTLNCSIEPMDIDETMPGNVSILNSPAVNKSVSAKSSKDLSTSNVEKVDSDVNKSTLAGKKSTSFNKSLLSHSNRHEKTSNENKSTLILSQLKDDSASEPNVTKSPKKKEESSENADVSKTKRNSISITDDLSKTPLKNKHLQKSGMQTSTPVIPTNNDKSVMNNSKITPQKERPNISKSGNKYMESSDASSRDSSDEDLLNDEAQDAGDDYESGDSQDASERQYEEENEIVERGETLTSEEDVSDDSDYEKDSFIVSLDEEDQQLLSDSGDDLSLGENELNMSAKSKKKYNERKVKEQKKASREMYEARHGKKKSLVENSDSEDTSEPVKKNNRQRIDSSPVESGDDSVIKPRKNNRLRLDSTNDVSAVKSDADESTAKNSKKKPPLDNTNINEAEITLIGNESVLQNKDPLEAAVKAEPKTPQKNLDISTVNFSAVMDVEQVQVTENASIWKGNETSDPLQATMAYDDEDLDSSSGNEEIIQNYESMLSNLTKENKKCRTANTSLNLNKKTIQKSIPIIDQLNITETKTVKKPTGKSAEIQEHTSSKKTISDDESSSDSIDIKLLFPNDTSESSDGEKKDTNESCYPGDEDFIPLKRTEGKTNLRESIDTQKLDGALVKTPASKKKKNHSISESLIVEFSSIATEKDMNMSVDQAGGIPGDLSLSKTPGSSKKKKKISESIRVQSESSDGTESAAIDTAQAVEENVVIVDDRIPTTDKKQRNSISLGEPLGGAVNVSVTSSSKKKKKLSDSNDSELSSMPTPGSAKRNKKHSVSLSEDQIDGVDPTENVAPSICKKNRKSSESEGNQILPSILTPGSAKKNKKLSVSLTEDQVDEILPTEDVAPSTSKNRKSSEICEGNEDVSLALTPGSTKKSKKHSVSQPTGDDNSATEAAPSSSKKKNRKSSEPSEASKELPSKLTPGNSKKNKKLSESLTGQADEIISTEDVVAPSTSKNRKSSETCEGNQDFSLALTPRSTKKTNKHSVTGNENNLKEPAPSSTKKKNRKSSEPSEASKEFNIHEIIAEETNIKEYEVSKKRKRNSSIIEEIMLDSLLDKPHMLLTAGSQRKKKRKISENVGDDQDNHHLQESEIIFKSESSETQIGLQNTKSKKKKKSFENQIEKPVIPEKSQQSKKRKQRSDGGKSEHAKAIKETFLENITVPRLPTNILDQLDEKPNSKETGKKTELVSTSAFEIIETIPRKNKPSQYLEESIYLNSDSPEKKRRKKNIEKPKVLPFVPTASTSASGFTTNFKVNINPRETTFIAQPNDLPNFKRNYLLNKKLKKLGTFDMYKKQRNVKLCKF